MDTLILKRVLNSNKIKNATGLIEIYVSAYWKYLRKVPDDNILRYIGKSKSEFINPVDSNRFKRKDREIYIEHYEDETEEMRAIRMEVLAIGL